NRRHRRRRPSERPDPAPVRVAHPRVVVHVALAVPRHARVLRGLLRLHRLREDGSAAVGGQGGGGPVRDRGRRAGGGGEENERSDGGGLPHAISLPREPDRWAPISRAPSGAHLAKLPPMTLPPARRSEPPRNGAMPAGTKPADASACAGVGRRPSRSSPSSSSAARCPPRRAARRQP